MSIQIEELSKVLDRLLQHSVYQQMYTPERMRIFMKHHAFAVWDFMSLLKRLQQLLTCVEVPWIPRSNPDHARFILEIMIDEETDLDGRGGYISHYELYLEAMREAGADTKPIEAFVVQINAGTDPFEALALPEIPRSVAAFVQHNLNLALNGQPHEVAAAFFYGREDLIPDMFTVLVQELEKNKTSSDRLTYYLERHIELDGDEHGPLAEKLLRSLCGDDPVKLQEVDKVSQVALQARISLWDGVLAEIEEKGL